ncbi:MAG: DUF5058 family protein [Sedimentibacter sp.]
MDYMVMANHPFLWVLGGIMVSNAVVQSLLFLKSSIKTAYEIGLTKKQVRGAIRASIITTIPPSIAMGVALLALMSMVGKPIAWARLSVIGALVYEAMVATMSAANQGLTFATMTPKGYVIVMFCMALATIIWQVMPMLFAPQYGKMYKFMARGDIKIIGIISLGAIMGATVGNTWQYIKPSVMFTRTFWAAILGAATYYIGAQIMKKYPKAGWLQEWIFTISMFVGMFGVLLIPA